jgi:hypothetical protein
MRPDPRGVGQPLRALVAACLTLCACYGKTQLNLDTSGQPPPLPILGDGGSNCGSATQAAVSAGRRLTPAEYQNAVRAIFGGVVTPSAQYPGLGGTSLTGFSTEPPLSAVSAQAVQQLMLAAEDVAIAVDNQLPALLPCATSSPNAQCANTFISTYARRAYRRTLTADESNALLATFNQAVAGGSNFTDAIALMTDQLMQSPQFLYILEDAAPVARALTSTEMASRLSFLLWDSIPDDALLALADSNGLQDASSVMTQAQRLLASPAASGAATRFVREWSGTTRLLPADKDATLFPYLNDAFAASFNTAFDKFSEDQMLGQSSTLGTLLTAPYAWVDGNLAPFWGVSAPDAGQWQRVDLDPARYAGLTTQPAVMASLAHSTTSSFIFRGKFIRERLLCQVLGAPPPNATTVFGSLSLPPNPTGKEQSTAILSVPACSSCHTLLNPPGLAFETFDAMGKWRGTNTNGTPVDSTGTMTDISSPSFDFVSGADLMQHLAGLPEVQACFAQQLFRFALSRVNSPSDTCSVQAIHQSLSQSGGQLPNAILAITATDAFRYRVDP